MTQPATKLSERLNVTSDVAQRLTQSLSRVEEGQPDTYRTPFLKELSTDVVLGKWDEVFQPISKDLDGELLNLEQANREKYGPRSIAKPWTERKASLEDYFKPYAGTGDPEILVRMADGYLNRRPLRPTALVAASKLLKRNTSSGLPFLKPKGDVIDETLDNFEQLIDRHDPFVLFTRTQEAGKTRNVWGDSIARTLHQQTFFPGLLNIHRGLDWRSSVLGPDATNQSITRLFARAQNNDETLISIDFSAYDASIKPELIVSFTHYLKSLFQTKYAEEIDNMMADIVGSGIVTPDGVRDGVHGNPSGNSFTLELNSVVQRLVALSSGLRLSESMSITGDDGVYALKEAEVDKLKAMFNSYGLVVNDEKSHVSKDFVVYLQNYFSRNYQLNGVLTGIYPTYRALMRIVFQERWSNFDKHGLSGDDYYAIRTVSILENCKHHPFFRQLVEFVSDNFTLTFKRSSLNKYIEMANLGKGTVGTIRNQYSDDIRGIGAFQTVKLLRELGR